MKRKDFTEAMDYISYTELCRVHWHPSWGFVLPAAVVKVVIQQHQHDAVRIIGFEFCFDGECKTFGVMRRDGVIHSFDDIPERVQKKIWRALLISLRIYQEANWIAQGFY